MRRIEGYLSKRAQKIWKDAIVYRDLYVDPMEMHEVTGWIRDALECLTATEGKIDQDRGHEVWRKGYDLMQDLEGNESESKFMRYVLEYSEEEMMLGENFKEAKMAIEALLRQKEAEREGKKGADPV